MQKQKVILIIGIVLAVLSLIFVNIYLGQQRQAIKEEARRQVATFQANFQESQTSVLVAKEDIPKGAPVELDKLAVAIVPREAVQPQAANSLDRIEGMVALIPIPAGDQITLAKVSKPTMAGGLAAVTPIGKRAVTVSVDNIAALVGMIKPGDYVDVISLVPVPVDTPEGRQTEAAVIPLFQNILVLAVGQDIGGPQSTIESRYRREERPQEISPLITLALTPQEANFVSFVQEQGKIRLILRSPADSQIQVVQPANWATLFNYVMPITREEAAREEAKPEIIGEPRARGDTVEIYRGLNKESMVLSK